MAISWPFCWPQGGDEVAAGGQILMALDNATTNNKSSGVGSGATGCHSCYPIDPQVLPKASAKHL